MRVALPPEIVGGPVAFTREDLTAMEVYRGWLGEAPVCVIMSSRPKEGRHLRAMTASLTEHFVEDQGDGRPVQVRGAAGARRVDGLCEMELGLAADWIEWVTVIVAATRREFVVLTVRTRPGDELAALHDELVASFDIRPAD